MLSVDTDSFARSVVIWNKILQGMKINEKFRMVIDYDPAKKKMHINFSDADDIADSATVGDVH